MNLIDIRNKLNLGISLSNINLRVTYYVRVSTDNVLQINSLNNQIEYFYEIRYSISGMFCLEIFHLYFLKKYK